MTFLQLKNIINALPDDMDESMFYYLYRQLRHTSYVDTDDAVNLAKKRTNENKELVKRLIARQPYNCKQDVIGVYGRCPSCSKFVSDKQNFCSNCGTKIDWSDIAEDLIASRNLEDEE